MCLRPALRARNPLAPTGRCRPVPSTSVPRRRFGSLQATPAARIRAMPLRNRVTPLGDVIAAPSAASCTATAAACTTRRATSSGAPRRSVGSPVSCRTAAGTRERRRGPGRFTGLFFLDDATAFAAGPPSVRALPARGLPARPRGHRIRRRRRDRSRSAGATNRAASAGRGRVASRRRLRHARRRAAPRCRRRGAAVVAGRLRACASRSEVSGVDHSAARSSRCSREGWEPLVPFLHPSARATMTT